MAILVNSETRLIVQGITGQAGSLHTRLMMDYGTVVAGGVTPGKGGEWVHGRPVFDSVRKAIDATDANTSVIFTPAAATLDAICEAIDAGINLIICVTQGVPVRDSLMAREYIKHSKSRLIGPNSPGILTPNQVNAGIIPNNIGLHGSVGVVSNSAALMYKLVHSLTQAGIGQTTCVGIGEDPLVGTPIHKILELFEDDPETEKIVLMGQGRGVMEFEAADFIRLNMTKPITAFIDGYVTEKVEALSTAGAMVARTSDELPVLLQPGYDV